LEVRDGFSEEVYFNSLQIRMLVCLRINDAMLVDLLCSGRDHRICCCCLQETQQPPHLRNLRDLLCDAGEWASVKFEVTWK